jgi:hypothetical protein
MEILRQARRAEFENRATRRLEKTMLAANRNIDAEFLAVQVQRGIDRAARYGIVRECDVVEYIEILCLYFGGFENDEDPELVVALVGGPSGAPEAKLRRLRERAETRAKAIEERRRRVAIAG